jgi:hypothetical protein
MPPRSGPRRSGPWLASAATGRAPNA